jgi:DNA polymerase
MGGEMNRVDGLRELLHFYRRLGFEYLPVKTEEFRDSVFSSYKDSTEAKGKYDRLKELRQKIGICKRCKLSANRTNVVFGEGNPDARLMFVGEGPGREEDIQARPFVGEAGGVLTSLITRMGFKREDVYIANVVKCRPPMNRNPQEDEISACLPFLEEQISIISPRVIFCLGKISVQALLGIKAPISKIRGHFYTYRDIPVMPTFHPAYLLRNSSEKWKTWDDAQKVLEKLKED